MSGFVLGWIIVSLRECMSKWVGDQVGGWRSFCFFWDVVRVAFYCNYHPDTTLGVCVHDTNPPLGPSGARAGRGCAVCELLSLALHCPPPRDVGSRGIGVRKRGGR